MKSNNLWRAAFLFFLFLMANTASAVSIVVTGSRYESGGVRYFFTISDWQNIEPACRVGGRGNCEVIIAGVAGPGDTIYWKWIKAHDYWYTNIQPSLNSAELLLQMKAKGFAIPFEGSLFVPESYAIPKGFCISFAQSYPEYDGRSWKLWGPCARVDEPPRKCQVNGDTVINHGNLSDDSIDGNKAFKILQLTCTGVSSVIASASKESPSGVKLRADGSLYSKITIEGKPAADGVRINVEEGLVNSFSIESKLFRNGTVKPGAFSGSTVLTISLP